MQKIFLRMINHPISCKHHKLTPQSTRKALNVELKRWQMIYIHLESYDKQHTKKIFIYVVQVENSTTRKSCLSITTE